MKVVLAVIKDLLLVVVLSSAMKHSGLASGSAPLL
jgi:hypothetical protein